MHSLEPFLLLLSSVFVPLFGVILGRLSFGGYQRTAVQAPIHWLPVCIWLCGIALYHALAAWAPVAGSAIPTLVVTFVVAFARRVKGDRVEGTVIKISNILCSLNRTCRIY